MIDLGRLVATPRIAPSTAAISQPLARRAAKILLDICLAYALFWGAHAVYRGSDGVVQLCDSAYSLVVAQKWLDEKTLDLSSCLPSDPTLRKDMPGFLPDGGMPYHWTKRGNAIYYGYPLGSTILSLPFVERYHSRGLTLFHPDGRPNAVAEEELQQRIAARVSALIVVLFYILARFFCSPIVSLLIAAGFAFGSPVWSTLSRSLWSHTWMVFWLTVGIVLLAARRRVTEPSWRTDLLFGIGLGTALFWTVFVRAQGVFSAFAIGIYLLLHHRRLLLTTFIAGALWSAALVAASLSYFGTPMPPSVYSPDSIDGQDILNRFAWLMISPTRGLLVYCPYIGVVGLMLLGYRKYLSDAGLLLPAGLAVLAHTALFSCYNGWHGGSSYGPRYFCDVLPWYALATAIAVRAMQNAPAPTISWRKLAAISALVICFSWGMFVHYRGANSTGAWFWNHRAVAVGEAAAVKEWQHPQFLAGLTFEVEKDGRVVWLR
jgi:hypothetical protein